MSDTKVLLEEEGIPVGSWNQMNSRVATPVGVERQRDALLKLRQVLEDRLAENNVALEALRLRLANRGGGR